MGIPEARLFFDPQKMIVMSTEDGKVEAGLPIGAGVDARRVDEETQEAPTIAAGIERPLSRQVGVDGLEHRLPYEAVLVLHGLVLGGATPIGGSHMDTLRRPWLPSLGFRAVAAGSGMDRQCDCTPADLG